MSKVKFLAVNKQDPSKTTYINKKKVGVWMWGKRLSNYIFMIVGPEFQRIVEFDSADCRAVQEDVDELFRIYNRFMYGGKLA